MPSPPMIYLSIAVTPRYNLLIPPLLKGFAGIWGTNATLAITYIMSRIFVTILICQILEGARVSGSKLSVARSLIIPRETIFLKTRMVGRWVYVMNLELRTSLHLCSYYCRYSESNQNRDSAPARPSYGSKVIIPLPATCIEIYRSDT